MVSPLLSSCVCEIKTFIFLALLVTCTLSLLPRRVHHCLERSPFSSTSCKQGQLLSASSYTSPFEPILHSAKTSTSLYMSTIPSPSRKFQKALLEISIPASFESSNKTLQTLTNDEYLSNMVKETSMELYIYVWADALSSSGAVSAYVSEVYAQLWDEMIIAGNMNLECFVSSNIFGDNLFDVKDVYIHEDLDVVMSSNKDCNSSRINSLRGDAGVANVPVQILPSLSEAFLPCTDAALNAKIHFLDDLTADVPRYAKIAVGGTFDRIHNGHKKLLTLAASVATECLIVGITADEMLAAKANAEKIAKNDIRAKGVSEFLNKICKHNHAQIVIITNPYGPTIDGN